MQTFLPYPDFLTSVQCLDNKRLGKQRSECLILVRAILGEYDTHAWENHPVTKMWQPYVASLLSYGIQACYEWRARDFKDNTLDTLCEYQDTLLWDGFQEYKDMFPAFSLKPHWLGWPKVHASHRSNLLRKDPKWYGQYGWNEPSTLPYFYPV